MPATLYIQKDSGLSFLLETEGHNAAGRIRSIAKSSYFIENQTHDLPA
jgi:hypothetical protein